MRPKSITEGIIVKNLEQFFMNFLVFILFDHKDQQFEYFMKYLPNDRFGKIELYPATISHKYLYYVMLSEAIE